MAHAERQSATRTERLTTARKPRDYDAELQALMDRAKKLKSQKTVQLGELVQVTGADALPMEALAGALLAAVEQSKKGSPHHLLKIAR
jgi:hypothetical protein